MTSIMPAGLERSGEGPNHMTRDMLGKERLLRVRSLFSQFCPLLGSQGFCLGDLLHLPYSPCSDRTVSLPTTLLPKISPLFSHGWLQLVTHPSSSFPEHRSPSPISLCFSAFLALTAPELIQHVSLC